MGNKLETYREPSVQAFIDEGISPRIIRIKSGLDSHPDNTVLKAYEFTFQGIYFRVPRVRVAFNEDITGPLFDDETSNQIDGAVLRFLFREDKQLNHALTKPNP